MAAVSWTQFLTIVFTVDRKDMTRLNEVFTQLDNIKNFSSYDCAPLGGLATILNVISLGLLSISVMSWRVKENDEIEMERKAARGPAVIGYIFWFGSLLCFLAYFNPWFSITGFLSVGFGTIWMGYCMDKMRKAKRPMTSDKKLKS